MQIRAIFFDIDDTLFPTSEFAATARKNAAAAMVQAGIGAKQAAVLAAIEKEVSLHGSNYERHFDHVCSKFGCRAREKIIAAGIVAYHNTKLRMKPHADAGKTLLQLQKRGYLLYAASEGKPIKQWDKLFRLGLSQHFSEVFVTPRKSKAFYLSAAKAISCKPGECLMVGNRPDKDIAPAKEAGFHTAMLTQALEELARKESSGLRAVPDFRIHRLSQLVRILE